MMHPMVLTIHQEPQETRQRRPDLAGGPIVALVLRRGAARDRAYRRLWWMKPGRTRNSRNRSKRRWTLARETQGLPPSCGRLKSRPPFPTHPPLVLRQAKGVLGDWFVVGATWVSGWHDQKGPALPARYF